MSSQTFWMGPFPVWNMVRSAGDVVTIGSPVFTAPVGMTAMVWRHPELLCVSQPAVTRGTAVRIRVKTIIEYTVSLLIFSTTSWVSGLNINMDRV